MGRRSKKDLTIYEAVINSLSDEGRGIAKTESGKTVFVDNALPAELVKYQNYNKRKTFDEAAATEVLTTSDHRVNPLCKSFDVCGGCSLQHMSGEMQLSFKQNSLISMFKKFSNIEPEEILEPIIGPNYYYRYKARLGVRYVEKKNKILVGFREKRSNFLVDMSRCEVLHPKVGKSIPQISKLIESLDIYKSIPQIEVALGDDDCALIFRHLEEISDSDKQKLINFGKSSDINIYLQPKGMDSIHKIWPNDNIDRLFYINPEFKINYAFHPTDFTQVNPYINQKMVHKAMKLLDLKADDTVLDLFCGLGNFTLPLAKLAKNVIGVEGSVEMVQRGYENANLNEIDNVQFFAADLFEDCSNKEWIKSNYNKVLIDPPRSGADKIIPQIVNNNVEKILYISCNPATLARDAGILVNQYGFSLKLAGILNMFPQTKHVESLALFEKN